MTDIEAMKLALFALDIVKIHYTQSRHVNEAITALKDRLAQPADPTGQAPCVRHCEAMAFQIVIKNLRGDIERMKAAQPPQREWVGLTDEEINEWTPEIHGAIRAIEAKLKEKNCG